MRTRALDSYIGAYPYRRTGDHPDRVRGGLSPGYALCEKPIRVTRVGQIARVASTEYAKTIARQNVVQPIAPGGRRDAPARRERPGQAETLRDGDDRLGLEGRHSVGDQDHRLVILWIEPEVDIERVTERGLRGEQAKGAAPVMAQDELRGTRAQHAVPVEDDHGPIVREFRDRRIVAIAERRPHGTITPRAPGRRARPAPCAARPAR